MLYSHGYFKAYYETVSMSFYPSLLSSKKTRLLPSGRLTFCYGKSPFLMGRSTKNMTIFNSKLLVYQAGYLSEKVVDITIGILAMLQEADDIQELSAEGRFLRLQDCGFQRFPPLGQEKFVSEVQVFIRLTKYGS